MESLLEVQGVYKELGSPPSLLRLIDDPPKLIFKQDLTLRLYSPKSALVPCRVYVFDRAFIIGIKVPTVEEQQPQQPVDVPELVWFAESQVQFRPRATATTSDTGELEIYEALQREEEQEDQTIAPYQLCSYFDLTETLPAFFTSPSSQYAIFFTHIARVDEDSDDSELNTLISVNRAEIWFDDLRSAKNLMGRLQETIQSLFGLKESDPPRRRGTDARTNSEPSFGRRQKTMRRSIRTKQRTGRRTRTSATRETIAEREELKSEVKNRIADRDRNESDSETGEFGVLFCRRRKGFEVVDGRSEGQGIYVHSVDPNGLAKPAGICVGDKLVRINDIKVLDDTKFETIQSYVDPKLNKEKYCKIIFGRTRVNEMKHRQSGAESPAEEKVAEPVPPKLTASDSNDSSLSLLETSTNKLEEAAVERKERKQRPTLRQLNKLYSSFTLTRPKQGIKLLTNTSGVWELLRRGKRREGKKLSEGQRDLSINDSFYDSEENTERLFRNMLRYLTKSKEKTCVHSLKEIYSTEVKYLEELDILLQARVEMGKLRKNVMCKDLRNGRPFCEHFKPRMLCTQESRYKAHAIPDKDLDAVFLNVKSLKNINERISSGLRQKLNKLYIRIEDDENVGIGDLLAAYCKVFTTVSPFLTMYTQYIQRYTTAVTKQKMLRMENPYFNEAVETLEKKHGITLMSLINKPLHRITKYPLFFTTLEDYVRKYINDELHAKVPTMQILEATLKTQDSQDQDSKLSEFAQMVADLKVASKIVHGVVDKVNAKVGEAENLERMVKAYDEIGGPKKIPDLLQPWRRFTEQITIERFEVGTGNKHVYNNPVVYLFNDIVVVAAAATYVKRRASMALVTAQTSARFSLARKKAGQLVSATLARGSTRNLVGKQTSSQRKGPPRTSTTKKQFSSKNSSVSYGSTSSTRRGSRRFTMKGSFVRNLSWTEKKKTSGDSNGHAPVVDLTPVAALTIVKLQQEHLDTQDVDDEPVYILGYQHLSKENTNMSPNDRVQFYFDCESERDDFVAKLKALKEEHALRRKGFENARKKLRAMPAGGESPITSV